MFATKNTTFDRLLEKATSKLLLDPDWESIIQICDSIRQGDVQPSYAIQAIKKKIENENPHIAKFALQVLESIVKNCGSIVHIEIATRDFMEFMKELAKKRHDPIKSKVVELVQVWSHAFRNESGYKIVQEIFNSMKVEGIVFPALKESDAMFLAEKAPEWRDGELCSRCRVQFSTFNRKHHCRACGQVFCQKCSSKMSIIPKFGIEKEVRVCDTCYDQIIRPVVDKKEENLPAEYLASSLSKQPQVPTTKTEAEIQEEEELQLALALSQSEAEAKEKQKLKQNYGYSSSSSSTSISSNATSINADPSYAVYSQPIKHQSASPIQNVIDTSDMDPELAHYLNRNYWQQKSIEMKAITTASSNTTQPSAPMVLGVESKMIKTISPSIANNFVNNEEEKLQQGGDSQQNVEREQFLSALRSSIEIFVNRMKSNSLRGRSIANDSSVQTLFMTLNQMHPTLVKYLQEQEEARAHYESLQDKLSQLKDARDALDVLREENKERKRREQEEMERLRQVQLSQKLEVLRQQKQVYLEYQRQMALQRMQEQEMEMRRRLEMQKHEQQMRAMQYNYPHTFPLNMSTTFSPDGSPMHQAAYINNQSNLNMQPNTQQQMHYQNQPVYQLNNQPIGLPGMTVVPPQQRNILPGQVISGYPGVNYNPGMESYQPQNQIHQQQINMANYSQVPPVTGMQQMIFGNPNIDYQNFNFKAMDNTLPNQELQSQTQPSNYLQNPIHTLPNYVNMHQTQNTHLANQQQNMVPNKNQGQALGPNQGNIGQEGVVANGQLGQGHNAANHPITKPPYQQGPNEAELIMFD